MLGIRSCGGALLAALGLASAWTTDFTGYRLEAGDAGSPDTDAGSGGIVAEGGHAGSHAGNGSSGSTSGGAPSAAGSSDAEAGMGGSGASTTVGGSTGEAGSAAGAGGGIVLLTGTPVSCTGLASTCGPSGASSCCTASLVPGGTYNRSNQSVAPATISSFGLDEYEVSVGRFRNFAKVYTQSMTPPGAGKNPSNMALDPGWSTDWNARLPANAAALATAVQCASGTYTSNAGARESMPMTCLTWYEAFAFCIWDGGRLPTEAEWNYAAAGGAEERPYPWGSELPDDQRAVFLPGSSGLMQVVGGKAPLGNGKWGQADMAGNAWEWTLDVFATPYVQTDCQDCANTSATVSSVRVFRGGSTGNSASFMLAATRNNYDPTKTTSTIGVRCARTP